MINSINIDLCMEVGGNSLFWNSHHHNVVAGHGGGGGAALTVATRMVLVVVAVAVPEPAISSYLWISNKTVVYKNISIRS